MNRFTPAVLVLLIGVSDALAEELADPDLIRPLKTFAPPPPITPNIAQSYQVENQFDHTDRTTYFSVTDNINNGMSPLKFSSGFYGKNFYHSLWSGVREANYYIMANLNHTKANNYKDGNGRRVDGNGRRVNWGYARFNQALILGYVPDERQEYRLTFIHDKIDDDEQPQHQTDAVKTERTVARFNARLGLEDLSDTLNFEVGYRRLNRRADNYTLRSSEQNMFVELDRDVLDLTLKYDTDFGRWHNLIGVSYQNDHHNGERYLRTGERDILNGYRFANLAVDRYRLFDTLSYKFNHAHKVGLGLSYEFVDAYIGQANAQIPNLQNTALFFADPNRIWQYHYGKTVNGKINSDGGSVELKYEFSPDERQNYSLSAGHLERIGDNVERFNSLAALVYHRVNGRLMNQSPAAAIVGNPFLKPEEHNFIKFSAELKNENYNGYLNSLLGDGWSVGGGITYDRVKNLIIFDRARGQDSVAVDGGGVIMRNVDADLLDANLYARYNFLRHWAIGGKAVYRYGQNTTDKRPLYQIRPFELQLNLDYKNYFSLGSYNLGTALRYIAKQTRGDFDVATGLGIDRKAAAHTAAITDLYAGVNIKDRYGVKLGVNNLFNRQYAEFLSGDHVMALSPNVVYAPGRTYWFSLHAAF